MDGQNLLFIFSDEHTRGVTGCYGNDLVKTPNLDRLAARGTRFDAAYCNCPICVPSRASLATGRYVHDIRCWDNAHPYDGSIRGWGHRLIDDGHEVAAVGKLHYRTVDDLTGFSEQINTLHVVDGIGDLLGLLRRELPKRHNIRKLAQEAGPGESTYTHYDRAIVDGAKAWLEQKAKAPADRPWLLYVGFVLPHFPLVAPPEFYDLYNHADLPMPRFYGADQRPDHPVLNALRSCMNYDDFFEDEARIRTAIAAYYGMVSFLDHNIGLLLQALDELGLADGTRVVYSSDHGDNLGNRGLWGKSVMYEEAVSVPMIMAGDGIPKGKAVDDAGLLGRSRADLRRGAWAKRRKRRRRKLPGRSLFALAESEDPERVAFSEYHAVGATAGMYMIRKGRWKYIHYVGHRPQLFDLEADPHEGADLGESADHAAVRAELEAALRQIVDPDEINALAFADQQAKIDAHGGPDAIKERGDFGYTPAPGQTPIFG